MSSDYGRQYVSTWYDTIYHYHLVIKKCIFQMSACIGIICKFYLRTHFNWLLFLITAERRHTGILGPTVWSTTTIGGWSNSLWSKWFLVLWGDTSSEAWDKVGIICGDMIAILWSMPFSVTLIQVSTEMYLEEEDDDQLEAYVWTPKHVKRMRILVMSSLIE